jgi:hypothetical protein
MDEDLDALLDFLSPEKPTHPAPVEYPGESDVGAVLDLVFGPPVQPLRECLAPTVELLPQHLKRRYPFETTSLWTPDEEGDQLVQLNFIQQLYEIGPFSLADLDQFLRLLAACDDSGIYLLYYCGDEPYYMGIKSLGSRVPIYGGVSAGADDGSVKDRLIAHRDSLRQVKLPISDFTFRLMMLAPHWAAAAEKILIQRCQPIWNSKGCDGFGARHYATDARAKTLSAWDTLHPGRKATEGKAPGRRTRDDVLRHLEFAIRLSQKANEKLDGTLDQLGRLRATETLPIDPNAWKALKKG